ncbi:MAG: glycerol-3-phosphate acyltransferase [Chloroflexi bacterium]|nr:glycerol-3-phosphate acyltransferase [Chloroflexota bacterium]
MKVVYLILAGLIGYLTGAVPFGFFFVRLVKGIDLREVGSGRTGGTNSMRAAGFGVGVLTFLSDVLKGATAVWLTRLFLGGLLPADWLPWAEIVAGGTAVIGHNWSVFLKFKGGAGTGPNLGWATAVWWPMLPINIVIGGILLRKQGMASVASLAVAGMIIILFVARYFIADIPPAYPVGGAVTAAIVAWSLRPNIKRIMAGDERVVGPRSGRR